MTNLKEARPVIFTCLNILWSLYDKHPHHAFGLIGANRIGESENNTKRYRVYKKFIATYLGETTFEHFQYKNKSAYILVRKASLGQDAELLNRIQKMFADNFDYFD